MSEYKLEKPALQRFISIPYYYRDLSPGCVTSIPFGVFLQRKYIRSIGRRQKGQEFLPGINTTSSKGKWLLSVSQRIQYTPFFLTHSGKHHDTGDNDNDNQVYKPIHSPLSE